MVSESVLIERQKPGQFAEPTAVNSNFSMVFFNHRKEHDHDAMGNQRVEHDSV